MVIIHNQTDTVLKIVSAALQKGEKHEKNLYVSTAAINELQEEREMWGCSLSPWKDSEVFTLSASEAVFFNLDSKYCVGIKLGNKSGQPKTSIFWVILQLYKMANLLLHCEFHTLWSRRNRYWGTEKERETVPDRSGIVKDVVIAFSGFGSNSRSSLQWSLEYRFFWGTGQSQENFWEDCVRNTA